MAGGVFGDGVGPCCLVATNAEPCVDTSSRVNDRELATFHDLNINATLIPLSTQGNTDFETTEKSSPQPRGASQTKIRNALITSTGTFPHRPTHPPKHMRITPPTNSSPLVTAATPSTVWSGIYTPLATLPLNYTAQDSMPTFPKETCRTNNTWTWSLLWRTLSNLTLSLLISQATYPFEN